MVPRGAPDSPGELGGTGVEPGLLDIRNTFNPLSSLPTEKDTFSKNNLVELCATAQIEKW